MSWYANARNEVADMLSGWPIGQGYYSTSVGMDEARRMAEELLDSEWWFKQAREMKAEAWDEAAGRLESDGLADGGYADHLRQANPYRTEEGVS